MGKLQGLVREGDNEQLRPGQTFLSCRKLLVENLIKSLENRFEMSHIIQAMAVANFRVWPVAGSSDAQEREGYSKLTVLHAVCYFYFQIYISFLFSDFNYFFDICFQFQFCVTVLCVFFQIVVSK
jgi:hypothetical protein